MEKEVSRKIFNSRLVGLEEFDKYIKDLEANGYKFSVRYEGSPYSHKSIDLQGDGKERIYEGFVPDGHNYVEIL